MRSYASKQIVPRRLASFTASINELSREFTEHLAAVTQRGGGNIDDMAKEVSKFALQGNKRRLLLICSCLFTLSPYLLLPPSLPLS